FGLQQTLAQQGAWYLVILGSVAVIVALWYPQGLWGAVRDRFGVELLPVGHRIRFDVGERPLKLPDAQV
ncbi:MAG: branched-chain amino acid ABC transporter permease, partial [Acidimicrobiales bacterium]